MIEAGHFLAISALYVLFQLPAAGACQFGHPSAMYSWIMVKFLEFRDSRAIAIIVSGTHCLIMIISIAEYSLRSRDSSIVKFPSYLERICAQYANVVVTGPTKQSNVVILGFQRHIYSVPLYEVFRDTTSKIGYGLSLRTHISLVEVTIIISLEVHGINTRSYIQYYYGTKRISDTCTEYRVSVPGAEFLPAPRDYLDANHINLKVIGLQVHL